jgi:hypothetical protein
LLAASALCVACAIGDFKYIRNDLGTATLPSPRVGVVALTFALFAGDPGESLLNASTQAMVDSLTAKGYEPVLLESQLLREDLRETAGSLPLFRDKAFGTTNRERLSGVLVLRVKAFWTTPTASDGFYTYVGDTPVLTGGFWLDSYSPEGTLKAVRAGSLQGYDGLVLSHNPSSFQVGASAGSYRIKSAEEWAEDNVKGLIGRFVDPYRGQR